MNKEELQKRLQALMQERTTQEQLYIQAQSNLNAYNGAIQEVSNWIKILEEKEKEEKSISLSA